MSDSEDEAFQSADEGEGQAAAAQVKSKPKEQAAAAPPGKGKKQQKRNRKKKGNQNAEKEEPAPPSQTKGKGDTEPDKEKDDPKKKDDTPKTKSSPAKDTKSTAQDSSVTETEKKSDPSSPKATPQETPKQDVKEETEACEAETKKDSQPKKPENTEPAKPKETETGAEKNREASGGIVAEQPSTLPKVDPSSPERPTEQHESILSKLSDAARPSGSSGGWGWSSWGSSILSTATHSVSTFTHQVGEGLNTVLETVESTLGVPDPVELAKQDRMARDAKEPDETPNGRSECSNEGPDDENEENKEKEIKDEAEKEEASGWAPWGGWGLSDVTKAVGETSKNLVSGGLDVLETIGKTTYNVIAEGDHGLKSTIKKTGQKPNLSQILKDAKVEHEEKSKMMEQYEEARKANFGALFDENNGLVHLEALEQVSTQCDSKVQSLLGTMSHSDLNTLRKDLIAIKDKFEIDEESDDEDEIEADAEHPFREQCKEIMVELGLPLTSDRLAQSFDRCRTWLKDCQEEMQQGVKMSPKEVHRVAIQSMAELTANSVQQFHKVSQLLQMTANGPLSIHVNRADCLSRLTKICCTEVEYISVKFTSCLNSFPNEDNEAAAEINPLVTNVYLEASNSKTYIQDAFRLLLPVVQHTALLAYSLEKQQREES